ncbi:MAG: hypothetical protein QS721_11670 [Candidatus Endonucleobacter sp. (ex Gigantidas childressi)]|nr:hypothetical protein [Candidatus Endonucleobacter sp. (ex Gigantidas childressi)]
MAKDGNNTSLVEAMDSGDKKGKVRRIYPSPFKLLRCWLSSLTPTTYYSKNQGYNLEHNYGHGEKHLTTNLAYLTVLAFLVDQIQELCCPHFQKDLKGRSKGARIALWKWIPNYFLNWLMKT